MYTRIDTNPQRHIDPQNPRYCLKYDTEPEYTPEEANATRFGPENHKLCNNYAL